MPNGQLRPKPIHGRETSAETSYLDSSNTRRFGEFGKQLVQHAAVWESHVNLQSRLMDLEVSIEFNIHDRCSVPFKTAGEQLRVLHVVIQHHDDSSQQRQQANSPRRS